MKTCIVQIYGGQLFENVRSKKPNYRLHPAFNVTPVLGRSSQLVSG